MGKVRINGKEYDRIPCGENDFIQYNLDGTPCKDCGVNVGEDHAPYCEAEKCPIVNTCENVPAKCGGQLCGCCCEREYL